MEPDAIGDISLPAASALPEHDSSQINISDVIAAIQTADPTSTLGMFVTNPTGGGGTGQPPQLSPNLLPIQQPTINATNSGGSTNQQQTGGQRTNTANSIRQSAYVRISEQPAGKALRFRYECEGRSAGSIPGVNSTPENRTFPTIQVHGYRGKAVVVVSCVTKDPPYRPHPHNLVGREGCRRGVCTVEINSETMSVVFSNLGIQCVKRKDIEAALRLREEIRVDPFRTGFSHRSQASGIDLNAVRLCFQVFLEGERGRFTVPLTPVVSDPIYDKKAMSDLVICKLSDCSCTVAGGKEIILLCEKVAREDIAVRFFEEHEGQIVWEAFGDFQHTNVHKQVAISFRAPKYQTLEVHQPVKVYIQLKRPSDGATSEALPFDYLPLDSDPAVLKRKRQRFGDDTAAHKLMQLKAQEQQQQQQHNQHLLLPNPNIPTVDGRQQLLFASMMGEPIKTEPQDHSPTNFMFSNAQHYRVPQASPSPQPLSPASNYTQNTTPSPLMAPGPLVSPNEQIIRDNVSPMNLNYGATLGIFPVTYQNPGVPNYQQMQPQPQHQPHQMQIPWDMQMTGTKQTNFNNLDNLNTHQNPSTSHAMQQQQDNNLSMNEPTIPSNLSSLLDMDSQQLVNSGDLSQLSLSLFDNNGNNCQPQEVKKEERRKIEAEEENMTDSFTRLTTATMNELADLNQMYNNRNNC